MQATIDFITGLFVALVLVFIGVGIIAAAIGTVLILTTL